MHVVDGCYGHNDPFEVPFALHSFIHLNTTTPLPPTQECIVGTPPADRKGGRTGPRAFLYDIVNNARSGLDVDKLDYFKRWVIGIFLCLRVVWLGGVGGRHAHPPRRPLPTTISNPTPQQPQQCTATPATAPLTSPLGGSA